ncbi:hypothetical protein A2771_00180 [Candidatus Woesebacteria bacterium RIFCSPHIGHO2_01_FULL_38_26b]|uniref:Uncharacterized protein n=1 Tax=Candidatus Woesebacteria bacterium RIFCSPHIGHO2_01_FULL_38_26b TaxID=1802491 RepID=A0A1F7XW11_9BACT|nr:MAG: hypothetical protein A2771_00180 [Candidatus Woesebacteria bacterium RIFCSPHIGHO2_01_FULL_38_26b]
MSVEGPLISGGLDKLTIRICTACPLSGLDGAISTQGRAPCTTEAQELCLAESLSTSTQPLVPTEPTENK